MEFYSKHANITEIPREQNKNKTSKSSRFHVYVYRMCVLEQELFLFLPPYFKFHCLQIHIQNSTLFDPYMSNYVQV